jgi:hypothetical protein
MRSRMKFFSIFFFFISLNAFAQDLFIIKKSMNPKNVLHFKANVNNCKLDSSAVSAYWVMGEERGQIEGLTIHEKPYFQPKISYLSPSEVDFSIGAMEKLGSKIPDKTIKIQLENCLPKAYLEIEGREIQLTDINVSVNFLMTVREMVISGISASGARVSKKIVP